MAQAKVNATAGLNVRDLPGGTVIGKLPDGTLVTYDPESAAPSGQYTYVNVEGGGLVGWAALEFLTPVDETPTEPPVVNEPGLYSVAMTVDEVRQLAELYAQAAATDRLIGGTDTDILRRIGGDYAPEGTT